MAEPKILYAGVPVCGDARLGVRREDEIVIETAAPMPVGTYIEVDLGDGPLGARVVEATEGSPGQMRLATRPGERGRVGEKKRGRKKA